jgi:MFS family permease
MLYVFAIAFGLGWGNQAVLRFSLSSQVFGTTSVGLVFGIFFFAESITSMLGTYLGGYVFDLVGSYSPVFWIAAAVSTAAILLIALVRVPAADQDV